MAISPERSIENCASRNGVPECWNKLVGKMKKDAEDAEEKAEEAGDKAKEAAEKAKDDSVRALTSESQRARRSGRFESES